MSITVGEKFNRLLVLSQEPCRGTNSYWLCKCDCGNLKIARGSHLKSGGTKSCGCHNKEQMRIKSTKHGHYVGNKPSTEYNSWYCMRLRCNYIKDKSYDVKYVSFSASDSGRGYADNGTMLEK